MKTISFFITCLFAVFVIGHSHAQLSTSASSNPSLLANTLVGAGITVSNATLVCPTGASGTFSNGGSTNIGLDEGVMLSSGLIADAVGPNDIQNTTTNFGAAGDADLTALSGFATNDACKLEFDFEAVANQVSISYVFSSEEYLEFVNTQFNDVFGFLVSGPNPAGGSYVNQNIAVIPTNVPVTINSINHLVNTSFFVNNPPGGGTTIEYDGFTVVLTASLEIVPCETYHFKLAIADAADFILDSGVFLGEASFEASLQCQDITLELDGDGTGSVTAEELVASDLDACSFTFSVSQSEFVCSDEGENIVTVTADDGLGTVLTCEATITVVVPEGIISIDYGADCRQVYFGYGPESCTDITALASGGHGPYTWEWSTGESTETITVCPETTTDYYVTVTDINGCVGVAGPIQVLVVDVHCGNNGNKVLLCHIPPGNPENASSICVSPSSVPAHLAHGCFLGDCSVTADPCGAEAPLQGRPIVFEPDAAGHEPMIWPNPGNGELNLHIDRSTDGPVTVALLTPQGSLVRSLTIEDGMSHGTLTELQELNEGLYYVLIRQPDGQKWMIKWVKNE